MWLAGKILLYLPFKTHSKCPSLLHPEPLVLKVKVKVDQSCPTLCDPMDYTVHGILQARLLEWVALFPTYGLADYFLASSVSSAPM